MRADRVIGLAVAASGVALGWAASGVETLAQQTTLSARFFPMLLAAVLLLSGLGIAARPGERGLIEVLAPICSVRVLTFGGAFLLYALSFRYVDFRLGTALFMGAALWSLGSRRPVELIGLPIAIALGVWAVFRHGFTVLLPVWG
ncbi:MAG: tripartite tricarboxylate transporter TctB family protein [Defluviicoccus sp.]|nr:tripartite tricarboxylate transporter TctB family protein [Defluviicoccus sp.]MDE0382303.1 tripartite tricarboxylate transporter TctB family protein [Defluviicoccus sp.]